MQKLNKFKFKQAQKEFIFEAKWIKKNKHMKMRTVQLTNRKKLVDKIKKRIKFKVSM